MGLSSKGQEELDNAEEIKNLKKAEAALFISARFLSVQELVSYTDINPLFLKELLDKLREIYNERDFAIEVIEKNGLWKMDVKEEYSGLINKLATGNAEFTKAEQETLALIAYKQPIKQSVIIKIRGNKAYDHIKKFRELELVKTKRAGHTLDLSLSQEFYDYFNVEKKKVESQEDVEKGDIEKDLTGAV